MQEPVPEIAVTPSSQSQCSRLSIGLKGSYPVDTGNSLQTFLSPFASISEDVPQGADLQQEAQRLLGRLRPAFGLVLLTQYLDVVGSDQARKSVPEMVRSMCTPGTSGSQVP